jgi:hypothetical protein
MKPFTDAIALWMTNLGFTVLDTFDLQIHLIFMILRLSFELCASVCKHSKQWYLLLFKEGKYFVI